MTYAVLYKNRVKPTQEELFLRSWETIAKFFIQHCGALGSTLHKTEDGLWVAYSRWPDRQKWEAAWPGDRDFSTILPEEIWQAILDLKGCLVDAEEFSDLHLHTIKEFARER